MSTANEFLWNSLDAYETAYVMMLRQNKAFERKLAESKSHTDLLELSNLTLTKENALQKNMNIQLQDNFNRLRHDHEKLKKEYQSQEIACYSAHEEIHLLRKEVDCLKEAALSSSNEAETILTSAFLHDFRVNLNRHLNPYDDVNMKSLICSETMVEDLTAELPDDILRHRVLNLSGTAFEHFCCHLFKCLGYITTHRGAAGDKGIDFEIKEKDSQKTWRGDQKKRL